MGKPPAGEGRRADKENRFSKIFSADVLDAIFIFPALF